MTDHTAAIRARRAQSNAAIAARSADATVAVMLDDVSVAVAGGPTLHGRDASRLAFAEQFADPAFRGYAREPQHFSVDDRAKTATEMGRWSGTWRRALRVEEMRGTYVAHWTHTDLGWFIRSEVFVSTG